MTELFEDADVVLLLADYIGIDAAGKVNALGAGFLMTRADERGLIPAQHLAVVINLPQKYAGQQFAILVELRNEDTGHPVMAVGPQGTPEPLRIQQLVAGDRPMFPGVVVPDEVPVRVQLALAFPGGLQVPGPGHYRWHLEINGHRERSWTAGFHVIGPPPGPVFGGPVGPSDITMPPAG